LSPYLSVVNSAIGGHSFLGVKKANK